MSDGAGNVGSGEWTPIRVGPVSVGAAILAAILLLCTYITHPLPRFVARPLGVHEGDFADRGGLAMTWEAPTVDEDKLRPIEAAMRARNPDGYVYRDGRVLKVVLAGVPEEEVDAVVARMTTGEGLTFREVVNAPEMQELADLVPKENFEADQWRPEEGPLQLITDYYLFAPTSGELDAMFAVAREKGWQPPAGTHLAYEKVEPVNGKHGGYRSYVVRDEVALDGMSVARAERSYDPNTNRPIVLLDFNREGAQIFADVTSRIVGYKLAMLVDGDVRSAPVINGPIRGGRASITMGGSDPTEQEREADALVETLKLGNLPAGGHVVEAHHLAPTKNPTRLWLARILLALLAAFAAGGLAFGVLRFARPETRPLARSSGMPPWDRLAVMLVAPIALAMVSQITIFRLNEDQLYFMTQSEQTNGVGSIGMLGIMPVLTAYVTVELFALLLPTWRRRRNAGPEARQPITLAAAVVTVLLVLFQAWNVASYMAQIEDLLYPGMIGKVLVVTSLAAGTLILIIAAELIRWRGLGNGYGALLVTGWLSSLVESWRFDRDVPSGDRIVELVAIAALAALFAVALRWRVRTGNELALRFPSSSFAPLADAGGIVALFALMSQLPMDEVLYKAADWVQHIHGHTLQLVGLAGWLAIVWSLAFARPAPFAGGTTPSWRTWSRATSLSVVAIVLAAAVTALVASVVDPAVHTPYAQVKAALVDPVMIAITVAVVLDAIEDFRARRRELVVAWTLNQPHHVDAVQSLLAADGIPAHASASHLRSLLSFFGPFVPIEIQVPPEHAEVAREKLERLAAEA